MKFSVIVPIYNCEKFLNECLDSVLSQTFTDWECICINDGSTDTSGEIAENYASSDKRFKVIHKTNGGEGSARNAGLDAANGEWICFLDSDDILNERTLEYYANIIKKYPNADMCSVDIIQYSDGGTPNWGNQTEINLDILDISNSIDPITYGVSVCCIAYRTKLVSKYRFGNLKIGADRVFVVSFIDKANLHIHCNYVGYGYRTRLGSAVNTHMNSIKFMADLHHRMACLNIFIKTKKNYDKSIIVKFAKGLTEYMANCFCQLSPKEQTNCLDEFSKSLLAASKYPKFSNWRKLLMKICGKCNNRLILRILLYWPYWLKTHGINRQFVTVKTQVDINR